LKYSVVFIAGNLAVLLSIHFPIIADNLFINLFIKFVQDFPLI